MLSASRWVVVASFALFAGCSSSSKAAGPNYDINGGDGVDVQDAGAAGSGGSAPVDAAAPKGAVAAVSFRYTDSPSYPNAMCPAGTVNEALGSVDGATETSAVGASVGCSLQLTAEGWSFSGGVSAGTNGTSFSVNGSVPKDAPGSATIEITTPEVPGVTYASPPITPCTVTLDKGLGSALEATPNSIWAAFDCPILQNAQENPGEMACAVLGDGADGGVPPGGYFYFANCNVE